MGYEDFQASTKDIENPEGNVNQKMDPMCTFVMIKSTHRGTSMSSEFSNDNTEDAWR